MFIVIRKKLIIGILIIFALIFFLGVVFKNNSILVYAPLKNTVVIDPGHGGDDGGCIGVDGTLEKNINLEISKKLADIFTNNGYNVVMTRKDDVDLCDKNKKTIKSRKNSDLKKRVEIVNTSNCELLISVHINQYSDPKIFGSQVFYNKDDKVSEIYAKNVMDELRKTDEKNKRVAKDIPNKNLIFSNIKTNGILVECGFLSNEDECKKLKTNEYQKKIAQAIYDGVIKSQKNIK